jgi:hypothetical protein
MVSKKVNATFLTLFILLVSNLTFAQFTMTGKVINLADNEPLESVTVFVDKTSYGTKTDKHGDFTIRNVRPGHYELIVSMLSFKTYKVPISIQADTKVPTIGIEEKTLSLNEVKITIPRKVDSKYLNMFMREILGTSKFGKQCRIVNPKVIRVRYDEKEQKLTGYTSDFMIIENKALGYRLKYLVEDFERNEKTELISYIGYALFEPMKGNDQQQSNWHQKRLEAYASSLQHFLRSVLGNIVNKEEPGFFVALDSRSLNKSRPPDTLIRKKIRLYGLDKDSLLSWNRMLRQPQYIEVIDTTKLSAKQIVQLTDQKGTYSLKINNDTNYINKWEAINVPGLNGRIKFRCDTCQFKNSLYVTYTKEIPKRFRKTYKSNSSRIEESFIPSSEMNKMASLISIIDNDVFFDWNGVIINPLSLKIEGYWANLRLGDLLPIDYMPNN